MAKQRKNYSLSAETVAAIEAEAARTGATASQALEAIVARDAALCGHGEAGAPEDGGNTGGDHIADLRDEIASLRAQLGEKDRQLERLSTIATQAQAVSMATVKQLGPGGVSVDEDKRPEEAEGHGGRTPLRVRLGRWLMGGCDA